MGTRLLLDNGASGEAFARLGLELIVEARWFVVALAGFRLFAEGGRRDGTIDLGE